MIGTNGFPGVLSLSVFCCVGFMWSFGCFNEALESVLVLFAGGSMVVWAKAPVIRFVRSQVFWTSENPPVFDSLISWNICKYNLIVYMLVTHHDLSNTGRKILPADYFGLMKHSKSVMACRSHKKFLQVGFSHRECRQDRSPTDSPSPGMTARVTFHPMAPIGFERQFSASARLLYSLQLELVAKHWWNSMSCLEDNKTWFLIKHEGKPMSGNQTLCSYYIVRTYLTPRILTSLTSKIWNNPPLWTSNMWATKRLTLPRGVGVGLYRHRSGWDLIASDFGLQASNVGFFLWATTSTEIMKHSDT